MSTTASAPPPAPSVDVAALQALLDGEHADVRRKVREQLTRPEFTSVVGTGIGRDEYRQAVLAWAEEL
ncbi:MAG TPA: hypothetical protein VD931_23215, partial [Baekduia sp.]|nr:hypothetical protein [Baekduia sp.]